MVNFAGKSIYRPLLSNTNHSGFLMFSNTSDCPTLFIKGEQSNYINNQDEDQILDQFPNATFKSASASHWIHAEQPQATLNHIQALFKFIYFFEILKIIVRYWIVMGLKKTISVRQSEPNQVKKFKKRIRFNDNNMVEKIHYECLNEWFSQTHEHISREISAIETDLNHPSQSFTLDELTNEDIRSSIIKINQKN